MTIRAQSADGVVHEFPDGTPRAVVDGAMKRYATSRNSTGVDVANSGVQGLADSVRGMAGSAQVGPFKASDLIDGATKLVSGTVNALAPNSRAAGVANVTRAMAKGEVGYRPQTEAGKVAYTAGTYAPALAAPGSAGARVLNVLAPTVGTEIAGRAAEAAGAGEGGVQAARFVGGLAGGVAAARPSPAPRARPARSPTPSIEELRTAKGAAYDAAFEAGVEYRPESMTRLVQAIRTKLGDDVDPDLHKNLSAVLRRRVDPAAGRPLSLPELDKIRRVLNEDVLTAQASKGERRLAYQLRDTIDDFIASASADDVTANVDAKQAADTLVRARDLNTRVAKIENVQEAVTRARNRTGPSGSGGNIDNATRSEVRKVMERGRGWTPAEQSALQRTVDGGKVQNALRQFGKMSPSGNGLMQMMNVDLAAKTGGLSIPVSMAAYVAKHVANGMTQANVERVIKLIASGKDSDLQQVASMASRDGKVAALVEELKRTRFGSTTVNALSGGGQGPRWQSPWQGSARK